MADDFNINAHFTTTADDSGVVKMEAAQAKAAQGAEKLGSAIHDAGGFASETEDKLAQMASESAARMDALRERVAAMKGDLQEAGTEGGAAFVSGLGDGAKKGGGFGSKIQGVLDAPQAIAGAWQMGWEIGTNLWGAIERSMRDGLSWKSILGPNEAEQAAEELRASMTGAWGDILQAHKELLDQLENTTPDNALKWLDDMDAKARRAADGFRALNEITRAENAAQKQAIENAYQNKVSDIEGSDMSDAEKTRAKVAATRERDEALFRQRDAERMAKVQEAEQAASKAYSDSEAKATAARVQETRARQAAEADLAGRNARLAFEGPGYTDQSRAQAYDAAYKSSLQKQGADASSFGSVQQEAAALEAARKAAKEAEERRQSAALTRDSTRAAVSIESISDARATDDAGRRAFREGERRAAEQETRAAEQARRDAAKRGDAGFSGAGAGEVAGSLRGAGFNQAAAKIEAAANGLREGQDGAVMLSALERIEAVLQGAQRGDLARKVEALAARIERVASQQQNGNR